MSPTAASERCASNLSAAQYAALGGLFADLDEPQRLVDDGNVAEENDRQNALANKRRIAEEEQNAAPRAPQVPPSNDLCAGAIVIPPGPFPVTSGLTADITDATTTGDPGVPSCQASVSRSVWYTFTPPSTGSYNISTCAVAPTGTTVDDTVLAVYTSTGGCAGPFTEIPTGGASDGCDDDTCTTEALQSVLTTSLTGGTTYFLVLWKFGATAPTAGNTAVQVRIDAVTPPANDTCAVAQVLPLNQSTLGTTVNATNDYQLSGSACFGGIGQTATTAAGRDVVYSFTAPSAGSYSFRVWNNLSASDIVIHVASTCPPATPGVPVTVASCLGAANRNAVQSGEEVVCLPLAASQQVFVFVDEAAATTGGSFYVQVENCLTETEPNDTPATANAVACVTEGAISPAGDVDFYSLGSPAAGDRIYVMVDGAAGPTSNVDARLTTTTDTLEYDDADTDFPFGNLSSIIAGRPAPGGPVFLRVNHASAVVLHEPARVYFTVQPASISPTAESEPNDTTGTADTSPANYFSGSLPGPAPSSDVDVYSFTAMAGDLVFLALDQDPTRDLTPIDAAMVLFDSGGTLVAVDDFTSTSSNASGAGTLTATTPNSPAEGIHFRVPTSGTYFVGIDIQSGSTAANGAGDYVLSISRNCIAGVPLTLVPTSLKVDERAAPGTNGNLDGVWSPGEQVLIETGWQLLGSGPHDVTGTASNLVGPPGATYTLNDTAADFGTVNVGDITDCASDCYQVSVDDPASRPGAPWTATMDENINGIPSLPSGAGFNKTWSLHIGDSFLDAQSGSFAFRFIETLYKNGVTAGCGGGNYCPDTNVPREQMAVFLLVSFEGPLYVPPACTVPVFTDVPCASPFAAWINELANPARAITAGCGGGNYCPTDPVPREQMAVFLLRTLDGPTYTPADCVTPSFNDVPCASPFAKWINELAARGIAAGCGGGNFCPTDPVTRAQMSVFLTVTFGLTLYGP